jgi:hypothetical protein
MEVDNANRVLISWKRGGVAREAAAFSVQTSMEDFGWSVVLMMSALRDHSRALTMSITF